MKLVNLLQITRYIKILLTYFIKSYENHSSFAVKFGDTRLLSYLPGIEKNEKKQINFLNMEDLMTTYEENMEFLTQEQMRKNCPSAFTEKPSAGVSQHYTHIPTFRVVEDMEKLGWNVVSAQEVNARKKSTKGTQKHMVTFRNTDIVVEGDDDGKFFHLNVGSGLTDENREQIWADQDNVIGQLVEIRADAATQSQDAEDTWSLRFPRFKTFRGFELGEKL